MADDPSPGPRASLGDRQSRGGPDALEGFDFQRAYALISLVESLQHPDFAAVIVEGAEDMEARFDRESGVNRRAVQVKNHRVTTAKAREIIARFVKLDQDSPGTWASFAIACTGLDSKLQAIHNLLADYRNPQGFYDADRDGILANTRTDLERKVADAGLPTEFVIERVVFEPILPDLAQLGAWTRPRVLDALQSAYPGMDYATAKDIYLRLVELVQDSTREPITRQQVESVIEEMMPSAPAFAATPAPPRHFVGRQTELTDLAQTLTTSSSPQTITALLGMGGIGKTALATKLAAQTTDAFPGGVFWADLPAHEGDPLPILAAWARFCDQNVSELPDPQARAQATRGILARHVAEHGRLLIILDDVRTDWLDGARALQSARPDGVPVLITTREAKVAQALRATIIQLDELSSDEARVLLATLSGNILTGDEASRIAKLCGCLPLALTLAAAIATEEGIDWLLGELNDAASRLDALALDDARRKEESVRLTFDVSYQALAGHHPETTRAFRYLGAFAPTFISPAHLAGVLAEAEESNWPGKAGVDTAQVKAADKELRRLARWALVRREGLGRNTLPRYSLHPLLRQYARTLLAEADETDKAEQQHLAYYLAFAQANAQAEPSAWDRLEEELPNLLLAAKRAAKIKDSAATISFEEALLHESRFLDFRGYYQEVVDLLSQSLAVQETLGEQQNQPRTLNQLAYFYAQLGQPGKAEKHAQAARRLALARGDQEQLADSLYYLGIVFDGQGKRDLAIEYFEQELEIRRELGNPSRLANCFNSLGVTQIDLGNYAEARRYIDKAIAIYEQLGDERGVAMCIANRGVPALYLGDYVNAMNDFGAALNQSQVLGYRNIVAQALLCQGLVQSYRGDYSPALQSFERSLPLYREIGHKAYEALAHSATAEVYTALGAYQRAVQHLHAADKELQQAGDKRVEIEHLNTLGTFHHERGDDAEALNDYLQMEALAKETKSGYFLAQSKLGLARVYLARGEEEDLENARHYAEVAIDLCQEMQLASSEPRGHAYLGQAHWLLGDEETALQDCREAMRLLDRQKHVHGSEAEIYLIAIQVLAANDLEDERRQSLEQAYDLVQATAAKIEDEALRQSYLAVPVNREIIETWTRERAGKTA